MPTWATCAVPQQQASVLYCAAATESAQQLLLCVQGACDPEVPDSVLDEIVAPPLPELKTGQCVLLTNFRLFQISGKGSPTWMDNLVVRLVWLVAPGLDFVNMSGADGEQVCAMPHVLATCGGVPAAVVCHGQLVQVPR